MTDTARRTRPGRGGGVQLGRVLGIPIHLDPTWFIFAAFITLSFAQPVEDSVPQLGAWRYAVSGGFAVLLALSVLLHELGHCVVSQTLGLRVRRVTIFLLGGVSEIEQDPEDAAQEYLVAVVGPLVSLTLGGLAGVVWLTAPDNSVLATLAFLVAAANAVVAVFNLLPGLPLDGGRVLRAAVWQLSGRKLAGTRAAARAGQGLAVLIFLGLVLRPAVDVASGSGSGTAAFDLVLALLFSSFIYAGAAQALRAAEVTDRVPGVAARTLLRRPIEVPADLPLAEALRRAHEADARGLIVVDGNGAPDAIVAEAAVRATPAERRPWVPVGSLARRLEPGLFVPLDADGRQVLEALRVHPASEYAVVDGNGELVGVLAESDVIAWLDPRAAARRARSA